MAEAGTSRPRGTVADPGRLSIVAGDQTRPLLSLTVDAVLRQAVAAQPDREVLVACHQGLRLTYAALDVEVDRLARGLLAAGLEPGDRIGIWAPNCAEWFLTMFAAARAGLI